ncbi:hypothetical protein, partial [Nocardia cyriacigeorgica]|uniref:hypothetical protein n=1 Tax=Nocardia cyriacigeorgica TaxID=135487 RepID=UPI0024590415
MVDVDTNHGRGGAPPPGGGGAGGAAEACAAEETRQGLARVTVDDLATDEMKQLPYQRLFMPSRRDDAYP